MSEFISNDVAMPVGPLKLAVLESCRDLGASVDKHLVEARINTSTGSNSAGSTPGYKANSYVLNCKCPRFGTGEGKGQINESVRGCDLYFLVDVTNYSLTYSLCGQTNHMSPDNHYQDLKRLISAANGKAKRITVIMPFLYEGRQHRRTMRESLDCSIALQELTAMGVNNIVTFDAHDPRVQNAIPLNGFDSFMPAYQFLKEMVQAFPDLIIDSDHMMAISPDEGAMERSVYFANILGIGMGMFYKRRDYTTVVNGKNPIIAHEFLGDPVDGKDCLVVDDMISSGESMLDVAKQLKDRGAKRVLICTTFGLFTDGPEKFDEYYKKGIITKVITTNLIYTSPELKKREWYLQADMSKYLASIIDHLNHDVSISGIQSPTEKIHALLDELKK